jgi:tetratricopeptide (TPR) repeat protein
MQVTKELGWICREQRSPEHGIDAQVEILDGARHTGRLLALQIKGGPSWFAEPVDDGWIFRFSERKANYWLGYALPVVVTLVDTETDTVYWQRVTAQTVSRTGKNYKLTVPRLQTLDTARDPWELAASGIESKASVRFTANLDVLPPLATEVLRRISPVAPLSAALIAAHLAEGRKTPSLITNSLLLASPAWISDAGPDGWCAVAAYCVEHELPELAAEAFQRAAAIATSGVGRLLALAGFQLAQVDAEVARATFTEAGTHEDAELISRLGIILTEAPPDSVLPLPLPEDMDLTTPEAQDDTIVLSFLAAQAKRSRDDDEVIRLRSEVLSRNPNGSASMLELAEARARRAGTARAQQGDLALAREWAEKALTQRRKWDGPTEEPLDLLLRVLSVQGEYDQVIRWGTPPPTGKVRPDEAARPRVLFATAHAARMLGRVSLANELAAGIPDGHVALLLRLEAGDLSNAPADEAIAAWRTVLSTAEAADEFETIVIAVQRLAGFGVDETTRLAELVERGIVPAHVRDLAEVQALASTNLGTALPKMRLLADVDASAAEFLVIALAEDGQTDAAIAAAQKAFDRFGHADFLALRADVLRSAGRDEAESAANEALLNAGLAGVHRLRMNKIVAYAAAAREDWATAERHLSAGVLAVEMPDEETVWNLVRAQINQGRRAAAAQTLERYAPTVQTSWDAVAWLQAMVSRPWSDPVVSQALTLASRFTEDVALVDALLAHAIMTTRSHDEGSTNDDDTEAGNLPRSPNPNTAPSLLHQSEVDRRTVVSGELRRRAFATLNDHIERHGSASGIKQIQGTTDELLTQLKEQFVARDDEPLRQLLDQVRRGRVPLGLISHATGRSYALAVVQRAAGIQAAVPAADDAYDRELEGAQASLNREIVVEASALMLATALGEFDRLRAQFIDIVIPSISRDDVLRGAVDVRGLGASSGSLGWDDRAGKLVFYELTAVQKAASQDRAEALDAAAEMATVVKVSTLGPDFDQFDLVEDGPWLAPIALAKTRGCALWSDDVAIRALAHSLDVPAFGTLALVETLVAQDVERIPAGSPDESAQTDEAIEPLHRCVEKMLAEYVVDLPVQLDDLLRQAERDDWLPGAAATPLTRPSWWRWQTDPVSDLRKIYDAVRQSEPEALDGWQAAALFGAGAAYEGDDFAAAVMVAVVAMVGTSPMPEVEAARRGLVRAQQVAETLGIPDPAEHAAIAAEILGDSGLLEDPEGFLEQVLRALPGTDENP